MRRQTLGRLSTDGVMEDLLLHFPQGYLDGDHHYDADCNDSGDNGDYDIYMQGKASREHI